MWMKAVWLAAAAAGVLGVVHPAGLDFLHRNSPTSQKYLIETMGGGVALLDYNNDGRLDVFFVNSGKLEDPVKLPASFARGEPAYWNRLYRQNADGSFTDVTRAAGLDRAGDANYGMGVALEIPECVPSERRPADSGYYADARGTRRPRSEERRVGKECRL